MTIHRIAFLTVFIALFSASTPSGAQWNELATGVVSAPLQHVGALRFREGRAWVGTSTLAFSTDTGATWQQSNSFFASSGISDLAIFDSLTILVGTTSDGLFLTTDGGQSWTQPNGGGVIDYSAVAFNGSASNLLALAYGSSTLYTSTDGGGTWAANSTTSTFSQGSLSLAVASDKTIYVQSYEGGSGWINKSTDGGQTWSADGGATDGDSDALSVDSCNSERVILVNENTVQRSGNETRIDLTTNGGASWQTVSAVPLDFYNGSIATTVGVMYVGTVPDGGNGVQRSTDGGMTWKAIGGPTQKFDTHTIATVNNNTILVLDSLGNVWRTTNSGGDSLTLAEGSSALTLEVSSRPTVLQQTVCDKSEDTSVPIGIIGCGTLAGTLDSVWVTGSSAFRVSGGTPRAIAAADSIGLTYMPSGVSDSATLHVRYTLGSGAEDTTLTIIGQSSSLLTQAIQLQRETASAHTGVPMGFPLSVKISSTINLDSLWPFVTDIEGTYTWDSSVANYLSYQPPSGWILSSLTAFGDSIQFSIRNGTPINPLGLGTATFQPATNDLATTWVQLSRLTFNVSGMNLSLCVTENEDNHWALQTLGPRSNVTVVPTQNQMFSLYPNPTEGAVSISSNTDLGNIRIEIYDMLGTKQGEISATLSTENPIELLLPAASGVYTIAIHSAAGVNLLRAAVER